MDQQGHLFTFLSLLVFGQVYSIFAISTCSHSFSYRQLCPNPMFVSGVGGVPEMDLSINLRNTNSRKLNQVPSSCEFFKGDNDVSVVAGVHVSHQQWTFPGANKCTHVVKFLMDPDRNGNAGPPVCKRDIGMRVANLHQDYRWNVYLWHNFTLGPFQANFVDSLTNSGYSESDVACTSNPQFVQIILLTSKNSKCSLLVQQYRIDKSRTDCDSIRNQVPPLQFQFCGSYDCSESNANTILQEMKLTSRDHPLEPHIDVDPNEPGRHSGPEDSAKDAISTTTTSDTEGDDVSEILNADDWGEWIFRLFFPAFGVALIFFLLSFLRGSYAKQILCRQGEVGSEYNGSCLSIEKDGLRLQF